MPSFGRVYFVYHFMELTMSVIIHNANNRSDNACDALNQLTNRVRRGKRCLGYDSNGNLV